MTAGAITEGYRQNPPAGATLIKFGMDSLAMIPKEQMVDNNTSSALCANRACSFSFSRETANRKTL
jgi:hypothetical protein